MWEINEWFWIVVWFIILIIWTIGSGDYTNKK